MVSFQIIVVFAYNANRSDNKIIILFAMLMEKRQSLPETLKITIPPS